jgi:general stress protein YciG
MPISAPQSLAQPKAVLSVDNIRVKKRPAARIGTTPKRRGFATMDPAEQRRIASQGGKASQASGAAHRWTKEEAQALGRKGGIVSRRRPTQHK